MTDLIKSIFSKKMRHGGDRQFLVSEGCAPSFPALFLTAVSFGLVYDGRQSWPGFDGRQSWAGFDGRQSWARF